MLALILIAFVASGSAVDGETVSPKGGDAAGGKVTISGGTVEVCNSDNNVVRLDADGQVEISRTATNAVLKAQRVVISHDEKPSFTIRCAGACKITHENKSCIADSVQIQVSRPSKMELVGKCQVRTVDGGIIVAAESIMIHK